MPALNKMKVKWGSMTSAETTSKEIPALDPSRVTKMNILPYRALPVDCNDAELLEWQEILGFIETDLHSVLCLPHDLFWCQAIFDDSLHRCIESYLQHAPRVFDKRMSLRPETQDKLSTVHRLVFMVCLRMATHKESKECFIDAKVFADIIYENFLFDLPKLMDICVLYGKDNNQLVSKMVSNIFTQQPKYWDDLTVTAHSVEQVLETIMQECGINEHPDNDLPRELSQKTNNKKIASKSDTALSDIVAYLCDTAVTLATFVDVYTPACDVLYDCGFVNKLVFFYDVVMWEVKTAIQDRNYPHNTRSHLHTAKKSFISAFHQIIQRSCITPILESGRTAERDKKIDDYLHTISLVIEYRRFVADYESYHPFDDVVDILSQANCEIDMTRIHYIQDAINHAFATYGRRSKPSGHRHTGGRGSPDGSPGDVGQATEGAGVVENGHETELEGACAATVSGIELESMISLVQDLLPDFGPGFIELCLEQFAYDTEKVVNALLEGNIPECLMDISTKLERRADEIPTNETRLANEMTPDVLKERRSVFDNDEFDVFNRSDIPFHRIHQGKKQDDTNILDDKSTIHSNRSLYNYYGSHDVSSAYDRFDMYEDDYDDTYDDQPVGADDADSADELNSNKQNPFQNPRRGQNNVQYEDSSSEEEEVKRRTGNNFCENPEVLRRRAAESRASKMGQRGGQGWKNQNMDQIPSQNAPKTYDVKGRGRGQGQDGGVLKNRNYKEQNKARKANHNRRNMADKKRSKGMMP